MIFAVTDIETTGGSPSGNAITEVAVLVTDGETIFKEFQSLINPRKFIPEHITVLTGISNELVEDAPFFEDIAEELLEVYKDCVFVAHNVNFDYSFLKVSFESYGFTFNMPKLCTVRYTRKVFPGIGSYSLGALCTYFGFDNSNPHRAMNDTKMALELLKNNLTHDEDNEIITSFLKRGNGDAFLPMHVDKASYHKLPEEAGVYYFRDSTGKVIYVGKAKNIKKRVRQHFSGALSTRKKQGLVRETHLIDFELTGTELIAALKEDREIKHLWPKYNSAQKTIKRKFGVFEYQDRTGKKRLAVQNTTSNSQPLLSFSSSFSARQWLFDFREKYDLPYDRLGLPAVDVESETSIEEVNETIELAISDYKKDRLSFLIKGKGRTLDESSVILVKDSAYKGFGFIPKELAAESISAIEDFVDEVSHSEFSIAVIQQFIEKNNAGILIQLQNFDS